MALCSQLLSYEATRGNYCNCGVVVGGGRQAEEGEEVE